MLRRVCFLMLLGCLAVLQQNALASGDLLEVSRLRCEYRAKPEGIDVVSPRLNWIVTSSQRGQKQTAYQILVASSPSVLAGGQGDIWDSGKVMSDQTLHVPYGGSALSSYQQCWWKVRAWDAAGRPTEWSKAGYWSMGILSADQWQGKWLGYVEPYSEEDAKAKGTWKQTAPSPMFRKSFNLKKGINRASLYICGLGFHEAYLNGEKVGDHVLDPAFTRYDRACLYVTHDVTDQVRQGGNAIGVMLGNGWYNVFTDAAWDFNEAPWRDKPRMLAQLRVEYVDGTTETIVSDGSWKAATGPVFLDGIRQGEYYDARREMKNWSTAGFDDGKWSPAELVSAPKGKLRAQMAPAIKVTGSIAPVKLTEPEPGVFIYDLGQNIAGWAKLKVAGPAGTKVRLRYGERLDGKGMLDQKEIDEHTYEDDFQTDNYVLKGGSVESWEPRFVYHGFQYVEVTGFPGKPEMGSITGQIVNTAFEQVGRFECSSDMINKMEHCTLWAYRGNFVGHPTDCPHREKNGWMGDAHLAAEHAMYDWANGGGYTKWMMDIKDEQKESGQLPGIVPTGGWGYAWGNGPAWDSAYLIIPWEMYRYYGDKRILATHFDRFKRYVDYLTGRAENHIINFGLNDWAPASTNTPTDITSTAYYYIDTLITANAADLLGHQSDAKKYFALADQIKAAYQDYFYKGDGVYSVGSQTALCFPLFYDLVPESEKGKVVANLVKNIHSKGDHVDTGILGAKAIFNVLSDNNENELVYKMIKNPTAPSYANWLAKGATTLWEQWSGKNSRNHIMFGDISAWFYKNMAGINLDKEIKGNEAFKHFILRPRLLDEITWVNTSYDSIRGEIDSSWKIDGSSFTWSVKVPANTTATIYVPAKNAKTVTESGRAAGEAEGVSFVKYEDGYAVYTLLSGSYQFKSQI